MGSAPRPDGFELLLDAHRAATTSIFRCETLQSYRSPAEDKAVAAFLADTPPKPRSPQKQAYLDLVVQARHRGCDVARVHVVDEPLSAYLRYEMSQEYPPNVEAGEDVYIWPTSGATSEYAPAADFWLFDHELLLLNVYDDHGRWQRTERVEDDEALAAVCRARMATLRWAYPLVGYIHARTSVANMSAAGSVT